MQLAFMSLSVHILNTQMNYDSITDLKLALNDSFYNLVCKDNQLANKSNCTEPSVLEKKDTGIFMKESPSSLLENNSNDHKIQEITEDNKMKIKCDDGISNIHNSKYSKNETINKVLSGKKKSRPSKSKCKSKTFAQDKEWDLFQRYNLIQFFKDNKSFVEEYRNQIHVISPVEYKIDIYDTKKFHSVLHVFSKYMAVQDERSPFVAKFTKGQENRKNKWKNIFSEKMEPKWFDASEDSPFLMDHIGYQYYEKCGFLYKRREQLIKDISWTEFQNYFLSSTKNENNNNQSNVQQSTSIPTHGCHVLLEEIHRENGMELLYPMLSEKNKKSDPFGIPEFWSNPKIFPMQRYLNIPTTAAVNVSGQYFKYSRNKLNQTSIFGLHCEDMGMWAANIMEYSKYKDIPGQIWICANFQDNRNANEWMNWLLVYQKYINGMFKNTNEKTWIGCGNEMYHKNFFFTDLHQMVEIGMNVHFVLQFENCLVLLPSDTLHQGFSINNPSVVSAFNYIAQTSHTLRVFVEEWYTNAFNPLFMFCKNSCSNINRVVLRLPSYICTLCHSLFWKCVKDDSNNSKSDKTSQMSDLQKEWGRSLLQKCEVAMIIGLLDWYQCNWKMLRKSTKWQDWVWGRQNDKLLQHRRMEQLTQIIHLLKKWMEWRQDILLQKQKQKQKQSNRNIKTKRK